MPRPASRARPPKWVFSILAVSSQHSHVKPKPSCITPNVRQCVFMSTTWCWYNSIKDTSISRPLVLRLPVTGPPPSISLTSHTLSPDQAATAKPLTDGKIGCSARHSPAWTRSKAPTRSTTHCRTLQMPSTHRNPTSKQLRSHILGVHNVRQPHCWSRRSAPREL